MNKEEEDVRGRQDFITALSEWANLRAGTGDKISDAFKQARYLVCNGDEKATDPLGLKWENIGRNSPSSGTEISNKLLAAALRGRSFTEEEFTRSFTKEEFTAFEVSEVTASSYIQVDDDFFRPATVRGRDGGLFTGETVLHIAIVKKKHHRSHPPLPPLSLPPMVNHF